MICTMTDPRKVVIYAPASAAEPESGTQLAALRDYAVRRGFTIYKEYVDRLTGDVAKRYTPRSR
jgi:hypothetical protein